MRAVKSSWNRVWTFTWTKTSRRLSALTRRRLSRVSKLNLCCSTGFTVRRQVWASGGILWVISRLKSITETSTVWNSWRKRQKGGCLSCREVGCMRGAGWGTVPPMSWKEIWRWSLIMSCRIFIWWSSCQPIPTPSWTNCWVFWCCTWDNLPRTRGWLWTWNTWKSCLPSSTDRRKTFSTKIRSSPCSMSSTRSLTLNCWTSTFLTFFGWLLEPMRKWKGSRRSWKSSRIPSCRMLLITGMWWGLTRC